MSVESLLNIFWEGGKIHDKTICLSCKVCSLLHHKHKAHEQLMNK